VDAKGQLHNAPQANNAYIFPAVGHAAVLTRAKNITQVGSRVGRLGRALIGSGRPVASASGSAARPVGTYDLGDSPFGHASRPSA
jgi:hypothetical protein